MMRLAVALKKQPGATRNDASRAGLDDALTNKVERALSLPTL